MSFNVEFLIWRPDGEKASGGRLTYEYTSTAQKGRPLSDDRLDSSGWAKTAWHSDWMGETVEVWCHTDGKSSGKPCFVGVFQLKPGAKFCQTCRLYR